jgi:capsular polysaccharide biosynthesis protein
VFPPKEPALIQFSLFSYGTILESTYSKFNAMKSANIEIKIYLLNQGVTKWLQKKKNIMGVFFPRSV